MHQKRHFAVRIMLVTRNMRTLFSKWLHATTMVALAVTSAVADAAEQNSWGKVRGPSGGPPSVVGSYSNGCISGAGAIPRFGPGYVVLRPQRNRFWGHPALIGFLGDLALPYAKTGEALLIADISQPRGGPVSGHASHQIGLDADIRLTIVPRAKVTDVYREKPPHISMLGQGAKPGRRSIDPKRFSDRQTALIRSAARDPRVDRLFVNPVIKRALCRRVKTDRSWLRKVVPWYGHDAHMHVRLYCPPGSPACVRQKALPPGDGCGANLAWWFTKEPYKPRKGGVRRSRPLLPRACGGILRR